MADLTSAFALIAPLDDEWRDLRFDSAGAVVNPLTNAPEPSFALTSGRHRQVGATYRTTTQTPVWEVRDEHRERIDAELIALWSDGRPSDEKLAAHRRRRRELSIQTGTEAAVTDLRLLVDGPGGLGFAWGDHDEMWSAELRTDRSSPALISGEWTADLSEFVRRESGKNWGCLGWLFGGRGFVEGSLDTSAAVRGGRLFEATGRINRFPVEARVDLAARGDSWRMNIKVRLRGRGLGRLVLLFGRNRIRAGFEQMVDDALGASDGDDAGQALEQLAAAVSEAGGPHAFVHRSLWDKDFDPELGTA